MVLKDLTKKIMKTDASEIQAWPVDFKERSARKQVAEERKNDLIEDSLFLNFTNFVRKWTWPYTYSSYLKILTFPDVVNWYWLEPIEKYMPNISINIEMLKQNRKEYEKEIKTNIRNYTYLRSVDQDRWYLDWWLQDVIEENEALQDALSKTNVFKVAVTIWLHVDVVDKEEIASINKWDDKFIYERLLNQQTKLLDVIRWSAVLWKEVRLSPLKFRQLDWLVASMPVFMNKCATYKEMTSESCMWLFPFTSEIRNDQQWSYIMWLNASTLETFAPNFEKLYREQKIANKHQVLFWKAWKWKSSLLKSQVTYAIPNHQQIVFDFWRDYWMIATLFKEDSVIKTYSLKSIEEGWKIPDENFFSIPIKRDWTRLCSSEEYIAKYLIPSFSMFYSDIVNDVDIKSAFSSALTELYLEDNTWDNISVELLYQRLESLYKYATTDWISSSEAIKRLMNWLEPVFTWVYKNLFSRKWKSIQRDKNLTVIDLYDIKWDLSAYSFVMFHNYLVTVDLMWRDIDPLNRIKRIVIDEAHRLTTNPLIRKTLATNYKEVRWEWIQIIISTQTVDDVLKEDAIELMHNYWIAIYFSQSASQLKVINDNLPWEISKTWEQFLMSWAIWQWLVKIWERDFICAFTNDEFLNWPIFSKEILSKARFKEWYFDTDYIDSISWWAYSNLINKISAWKQLIEEHESKKIT